MKNSMILALVATTGLFMASCDDSKKETTAVTTDTAVATTPAPMTDVAQYALKEGTSTTVQVDKVPQPIRTTFTTKYPKAQKVVWMSYTPVESDNMSMDSTYYYVRFNDNGADYVTWYDNRGEWVKTSTRITGNSSLPDAVNQTINAQFPGYTIEEINKENDKDMDMYEIKMNKGESKIKVKILPNGEIFKLKS
jgi:hypothetical protein